MNKIWRWIKENKIYFIVMMIGTIAFLLQINEVVLYADDFVLAVISKMGIKGILEYFKHNYLTWAGGLTCLWATIFLMFKIEVWKLFQTILVVVIIILSTKMITYKNGKNKALVASVIWLCLYAMSIYIQRAVLYWLDGSLSYMLTAFQIFLYFYYIYTRIHLKIEKKYDKFLLPVVAFFAGWSSAQTAILAIIIPLFVILWERIIKKEKISKFYYFQIIFGLIGASIFYLAPGNMARMNTSFNTFANYTFIQKILYRIDNVYTWIFSFKKYSLMRIPFYLMLFMCLNAIVGLNQVSKIEKKNIKNIIYIISIMQLTYLGLCLICSFDVPYLEGIKKIIFDFPNLLVAKNGNNLSFTMFIPYIISSSIILAIIIESYIISYKQKNPILIVTILSAFIMEGSLVMAPLGNFRQSFYMIFFLWIAIGYLINIAYEKKIRITELFIIVFFISHLSIGIVMLPVVYLTKAFAKDKYKTEIISVILCLFIIALSNYLDVIVGYKVNHKIYDNNISRIKEYKKNREKGEKENKIYIIKVDSEEYGFTPLMKEKWIDDNFKKYFDIEEVVFVEEKNKEIQKGEL